MGLFGPIEEIVVKQKFLEYCVGKRLSYVKRAVQTGTGSRFCKEFKQIGVCLSAPSARKTRKFRFWDILNGSF